MGSSVGAGTRRLLVASATLEGTAGVALLVAPSVVTTLLLRSPLESTTALIVARLAGAALVALAVACALARGEARAVVAAVLAYNGIAAALLVAAALDPHLGGVPLWAAAILHLGLAGWCVVCVRRSIPVESP